MGKTVTQLSPQEKRRYRDLARRERALQVAREAACVLKESHSWFHIRSDVDLAVKGLHPQVDLRTAPPGLALAIRRDGVEI